MGREEGIFSRYDGAGFKKRYKKEKQRTKKKIEKRNEEAEGSWGNFYWVWVTAPRARRGISVLEESFTGMVSEPLIFYCSYFLLC